MTDDLHTYLATKLREDGYDGLAGDSCGCELDDLAPCGEYRYDCVPGHKIPCIPRADCPPSCDLSEIMDGWCMQPGKRP